MSDLRIAVQVDGDERAVDTGTTAGDLLDQGKGDGQGKAQAVVQPGSTGCCGTSGMSWRRTTGSNR